MVTLTEYERTLPYVKYFEQELAEIPKEKMEIAQGAAAPATQGLQLEDRNKFLSGTDEGIQSGFCVLENGLGFVANTTFMPNVTVEMCDWWFGWHSVGSDLRYKLWDKEDHYQARADQPEYVLNPEVPNHQKTWGMVHHIIEDIGKGPEELKLCFKNPEEFGYDGSLIGTKKCESLVCAVGIGDTPAFMTHKFYSVDGGVMFESRFWMGVGYKDGELIKIIPDGIMVPEIGPRMLFSHNIKEYTNLAAILPHIYEEQKDNWTDDRE
ncbi:MAG: DAPG hydrolase family protein [Lachnospiraceae bacterium]